MPYAQNLAVSTVATAPSPATSGTTVVLATGQGARFADPASKGSYPATIWAVGAIPTPSNAEIVLVTAKSTDTLTITRAQEGTSARTVVVGDQIAATVTAAVLNSYAPPCVTPADLGLIAWTSDPILHQGANAPVNGAGSLYGTRMTLPACSISTLYYFVWVAGSGLTSGANWVGLIDIATGNRIAVTPDQSTLFATGGLKTVSVTGGPIAYAGGDVYATFLCNGSTLPCFACANTADTYMTNIRGSGAPIRAGQISSSTGLTTIPTTATLSGQSVDNHSFILAVA